MGAVRAARAVPLLIVLAAAGCRSAQPAAAPATPAAPPTAASAAAAATASPALPDNIRWVQRSAEYVAAVEQVYRVATARVESEARSRANGTWAVVLDADETVINNADYQAERARVGQGFSDDTWDAWVKRREAAPLPGAAAFLARVRALGGRVAIVTNRTQAQCADTEAVFTRHALVYDAMLCRPAGRPSDKNPRFEAVAAGTGIPNSGPLTVVAFLGDNILDFPTLSQKTREQGSQAFVEFGVRYFLLPNPMYGSWQGE